MPSSWPSSALESRPRNSALPQIWDTAQRVVDPLRDLLIVGRLIGHVVIGLLLLLALRGVLPTQTRFLPSVPALAPQTVRQDTAIPAGSVAVRQTRYLEHSAVPFTVRSIHSVLPLSQPQRNVRVEVFTYRVQSGDTVLGIAQQFGLKGTTLLWSNEKLEDNPDFLSVGQTLNILPVDGAYHTVIKSDTLESIAAKYKVDVQAITGYSGNELPSSLGLTVGQKLVIPGGIKPRVRKRVFVQRTAAPEGALQGTGRFGWPMSGLLTQGYWEGHHAIDIAAPKGSPIAAADAGYVAAAQYSDVGYGRMVIIDHGNGFQTLYAHLQAYFVELGESVEKGQVIGHCGSTGNSTGPHLHFEVIKSGVRRNPRAYLP